MGTGERHVETWETEFKAANGGFITGKSLNVAYGPLKRAGRSRFLSPARKPRQRKANPALPGILKDTVDDKVGGIFERVLRSNRGMTFVEQIVISRPAVLVGKSRDRTQVTRTPAQPSSAQSRETAKPVVPESHRALTETITAALYAKDPEGTLVATLNPAELAERLVDQLDTAPLWEKHLGPVYSVKTVKSILGISKQAVQQRTGLLRMTTGDGTVVYPAFQFSGTAVLPGVQPIVRAARRRVDDWTLASWFATANDDLGGMRPIDAIAQGYDEVAAEAAASWLEELAS